MKDIRLFQTQIALVILTCLIFTSTRVLATTQENGSYSWQFLSAQPWPGGYNQSSGKPESLSYHYSDYPSEFFDRVNNALPEYHINEVFLTDDAGANIFLTEDAEVFITFIHEGAGYKNAFGYFTFDKNNPPTSAEQIQELIVFPNLSFPYLSSGHRLSIGTFPAGTAIGFFIAANGFSSSTGVKSAAVPYYYSIKDLNPDPTDELRRHNVLLYDDEVLEVILGFEDLPRSWGDNDFNDAVFTVKSTPETAIDTSNITTVPDANDSDADGILDINDEFPNNYYRAFSSYYPSSSNWITLAFEDKWPAIGDYDLNDLVIRERLRTAYNANNEITGFTLSGFIDARGGQLHNGFALRLMGLDASVIDFASLTISGQTFTKEVEAFQTNPVISLWSDSHLYTTTGESGACQHFNTIPTCTQFEPVPFELDVQFAQFQTTLAHADLDFFIYQSNYRAREIHFADYPPTDLFDSTQLGKKEDTSDPASGRYFRNSNNLPWAIKVPQKWRYPREYIDVLWAYPDYEQWVESSGLQASDWFNTSTRDTHYY